MLFSQRYTEYDPFAWFYNRYWGDNFLKQYWDVVQRLFLSQVHKNSNIFDLCCGSGQLANRMSAEGYRVSGLDGSAPLLRYARENAPKVEFMTGDARTFTIIDKFEGVICAYDSLNHIPDLVTLGNVFNNVYSALKKGGVFVFDINVDEGFKARWRGSASVIEKDHVLATNASYDPDKHEGRTSISAFVFEKHWKRIDVTLVEHCFTREDILTRLSKSLFRNTKTYDSHRDLGHAEIGRLFFVSEK